MTTYNQHDDDVIKTFCQFVKISTNSIYLPSFIVMLGGGGGGGGKISPNKVKIFCRLVPEFIIKKDDIYWNLYRDFHENVRWNFYQNH